MITLLLIYLTSHLISFICSILEAVLLCCTNAHIAFLKKRKPKVGQILADLKARIDRPLAAVLTLNTAAHTFGAAGVGAFAAEIYGEHSIILVSVIMTLTMLYLTEMIPKTLGALYWKQLTPFAAYFIQGLIYFTYPFVISFEYIAKLLSRGKIQEKITEEEIKLILEEGIQAGVLKEVEHDMVESIFKLGTRRVGMIMVPRMDIEWLDFNENADEIRKQIDESPHNRFPVCDEELDEVIGLVVSKDILNEILKKGSFDLKTLIKPPVFVPENMRILQLLDIFKKIPDNVAIVTDEYGGVQGLVTLHDVLESIIGDTPSSSVLPTLQIVQRKDGSWLIDGMLAIDDFKDEFHIEHLPDEEKGTYRTLAGFCVLQIGNIPQVGDAFVWNKMQFRIIKMDGRRVERVLVRYQD